MSFNGLTAEAIATYAAGVLALIFAFLARFKKFKGLGIEAELWEDKQEEAADLIEKLKGLTVAVAEPLISISSRMGRWNVHFERREHFEFIRRIEEALLRNGMEPEAVETMKREWHRFNAIDLGHPIFNAILKALGSKRETMEKRMNAISKPMGEAEKKIQDDLLSELRSIDDGRKQLEGVFFGPEFGESGKKFDTWLKNTVAFTDEEKQQLLLANHEELADLRYYEEHRKFRRPEVWFAGPKETV